MLKRISALFVIGVASVLAHGQTAALPIYACTLPGVQALVSGISSTNYLYGIIRSCKVTVYLTGTTTIARTTPQSPFTANTTGSIPPIYAPTSTCYDVVLSGGIAPNNYPTPVTLTDVCPGGGGGGGGGNQVSVAAIASPFVKAGTQQLFDAIPSVTPVCDIRTQGAVIDGVTDIGPAVQACVNLINALYGGTGTIFFPCIGASGHAGCYWANSSALTAPSTGFVAFKIQGTIQLGSTFVGYGWENNIYGDGGGNTLQFQAGTLVGSFEGANCYGTLGTAITSANTATQLTINISGNVYGGGPACNLTNLPVGSSIHLSANTSSTATAVRVLDSSGKGLVTLTTASPIRIPAGVLLAVTGCGDSSFNVPDQVVNTSDYPAQTITYYQVDATPASTSSCIVTGLNDDSVESAVILASGSSSGTFNGVPYSAPGAGKVTIMTKRTHLSTDQWGENGGGPSFNTYGGQTWSNITFFGAPGMNFWAEGPTNLILNNVGAQAVNYIASGAAEFTADYLSQYHGTDFQTVNVSGCGVGGGCGVGSYPKGLIMDTDAAVGNYYSHSVCCGDSSVMDGGSWNSGGIKIGDGINAFTAMPTINSLNSENPWSGVITIDNRTDVSGVNCLVLRNVYPQDSVTEAPVYLISYTDSEVPGGCAEVDNFNQALTTNLTNQYFNGTLSVDGISTGTASSSPVYLNAPSGTFNEGSRFKGEVENEGASFGPQIVPFATLPFTYYSVASWSSQCGAYCIAIGTSGPDGPLSQMLAVDVSTSTTNANFTIGTWNGATYPGDVFLAGSWVRPGSNSNSGFTYGVVGISGGNNQGFYLNGDSFAPTGYVGTGSTNCSPAAFGPQLANNGWSSQVAICYITTGSSSPHNITFNIAVANGGSGTRDNQYAEPFWVFIPGPNNPACTAAGTCNLTADQIEEARRDQYHGFVPPGVSAGTAATGEAVQQGPTTIAGATHGLTIPSGPQPTPAAGSAIYSSDSGSTGDAMVSENGAAYSRICTAANSGGVSGCGTGGGTTTNPLTMNNSGSGASSGTTFDGSTAATISYNTIGAAPALTSCTDETSSFTPANGLCYFATSAATSTTPAASAFVLFTVTTSSGGSWTASGTAIADGVNCSGDFSGTTLTLTASQTVTMKSDGANIRATCTSASGTGNTTSTSLTTNTLPKANGANSIINSSVTDNGTTVTSSEPVTVTNTASVHFDLTGGTTQNAMIFDAAASGDEFEALSYASGFEIYDVTNSATRFAISNAGNITNANWQATAIAPTYGGTGQNTSAATGVAQVISGTWSVSTALASGTTATTQAAGDNSTKVQTTAGSNVVYGLVETSGSPFTLSCVSGLYWEASSGAYSWNLCTPPALPSSIQQCFGKSSTDEYVISIIPPSGVTIWYGGSPGTSGSSTGLVSSGTQTDYICLVSVGATEYQAIGPGVGGTWTNH